MGGYPLGETRGDSVGWHTYHHSGGFGLGGAASMAIMINMVTEILVRPSNEAPSPAYK